MKKSSRITCPKLSSKAYRVLVQRIFVIITAFLLSQCTKMTPDQGASTQQRHASKNTIVSPYTMPATAYLALAKNQAGQEKQALLIMAAGRSVYDGQWRQGLSILSQTENLSPELLDEKTLLMAKIDLIREHPQDAITKLSQVNNVGQLPIYYQAQFHDMLASAYQTLGRVTQAVSERIKLDAILPDEPSQENNRRALWLSLTTLPVAELETLAMEAREGSLLSGWMELALISRQTTQGPRLLEEVENWQQQYPSHPANSILPRPLARVSADLFKTPQRIALLLPLTGPLAGPGQAIKDGFLAAYQASGSHKSILAYDTYHADVGALYRQAIADGAEYIVGPLTKPDIAQVASLDHPVPTLLLNEINQKSGPNAYQFGLSPLHEARQVAVKARKHGYARALIIAPAGAWGQDIARAFSAQWQSQGGQVVETLFYRPEEDLNAAIKQFLHVTVSDNREKELRQALGTRIQTSSIRRQDFDMVFLVAYPTQARQIRPLLRYYYAGNVPVYATSAVYSGNQDTMKDRDLDGIIFCDMPWVFAHPTGSRNWPEQLNSYNRLYALGLDSYALTSQLNQLLLFPAMGVSDKSGVLYLTPYRQIARILSWGQFRQGVAEVL